LSLKTLYYFLLVCSTVAVFYNRKALPTYCKWLMILLPISVITQVVEDIIRINGGRSTFVFRLYQPVEMLLLSGFYYSLYTNRLFKRIVILCLILFFIFLSIYYYIHPSRLVTPMFLDFCFESAFLCVFIVLFFVQMLQFKEHIDLKYYTAFWLNAIHLIFYGGCLFLMGFYYYLVTTDPILAKQLYSINNALNLLLYTSYTAIFICTRAIEKSP
jgi:hypothetical protein